MKWRPTTEEGLWDLLNSAWERMTFPQRNLWEVIKIDPKKWKQHPWGNKGGGFWVVAILGNIIVWYNDIEEGFNLSNYKIYGIIEEYWCNQDELEITVQNLLNLIQSGYSTPKTSPPIPGECKENT